MTMRTLRWMLCISLGLLIAQTVPAAVCRPMSDTQLDQVYAAGFDIKVDLGLSLAATKPDAVIVAGGSAAAVQNFMEQGMAVSRTSTTRNSGSFDPTGTYMPNLQDLTVNNINISDNALQHASSLLNVFALEGDIAVGVNINVVVNPINSAFNVTQMNMNWGTMNLSDAFSTLTSTPSN